MKASCLIGLFLALLAAPIHAQTWTVARANVPGVSAILDLAYGNGRFVATTGGSLPVIWSADGVVWQPVRTVSGVGPKVLFIAGSFYAIGNGEIWRSADAETWIRVAEGTAPGAAHASAASDGRGVLTASSTSATLLFSPDMREFHPAAPLPHVGAPGTMSTISGIAHGAGRYFVSYLVAPIEPGNAAGYVVSSIDGSAWTPVTTGVTTGYAMAGNKDRFLLFMENRSLVTTDGTTFSTHPLPFPQSNGNWLVAAGGRFFMSRTLLSSIDGLTWTSLGDAPLPANADLRGFAYGRGKYIAAGFTQATPPADMIASLAAPAPPVFASQPASRGIAEGQSATLSVTLDNPDTATTFQWRRDGVAIPGATLPAYVISNATFSATGGYSVRARNALGATVSDTALITVVPAAEAGRLINLSVLSALDAPDDTITLGFVTTGNARGKPLLVRAAGPSLTRFGVATPHADPRLELFTAGDKLGENDNWNGAPELAQIAVQVGAFPLVSPESKDATLFIAALPAGNHTVIISGTGGITGTVIGEVYDATPPAAFTAATSRLMNLSVLKPLAANTTLSAGFVVGGKIGTTVLIRAVGPGLAPLGLRAPLGNPRLTLRQAGIVTPLALNEDWMNPAPTGAQLRTAFATVAAFDLPAASADAALLVNLAPGNYVAEVAGAANDSGLVLLEVYAVP